MLQGWPKHFSVGQAKYSAVIMHVAMHGCEAADYLLEVLKTSDGSTRSRHALVRYAIEI